MTLDASTTSSASLWGIGSANISLQALTVVSRSLLLLGLAQYLPPAGLGVFGLLFVTLNLALYLVGLDFNAFNARELLRGHIAVAPAKIRDQFVFHGLTYLAAFPLILSVFAWGVLPWSLASFFYSLLLLEHVGMELQRILITLQRSMQAAMVSFIRGGLWVFAVLPLMAFNPALRTVPTVVTAWILGALVSLIPAAFFLRDLPWRQGMKPAVDWHWIGRGALVSLPFLTASLSVRGIMSVDRFALERFLGAEAVGVYTLYVGARNAIQSLLDMGVVAVLRPRIVQAYQSGDHAVYHLLLRRMTAAVTGVALSLIALAALAIWPILAIIDNPIYRQHLSAYWLVLAVTLLIAIADIPHTVLYARHRDRAIVVSSLLGLVVAVAAHVVLVPRHGLFGAALAMILAMTVFAGAKAVAAAKEGAGA